MKADIFRGADRFGIEDIEQPHAAVGEAVVRVTVPTICGDQLRREYE